MRSDNLANLDIKSLALPLFQGTGQLVRLSGARYDLQAAAQRSKHPQVLSDCSNRPYLLVSQANKLQTACACMHAGADLSSKLSKLSYNSKPYSFCTASHEAALVLQRKAFHRNGADRTVGILHEAHAGWQVLTQHTDKFQKIPQPRAYISDDYFRQGCLTVVCMVAHKAQRDILNTYRRLCLQVSLKITCEAHRAGSLRFGGGWVS